MPKKNVAISAIDSIDCRGYEVIFECSGSMYAVSNCKIDPDGSSTAFKGVCGASSSRSIRAGEEWRSENWGNLFDAVGGVLSGR